ncbi:Myosin regulatory light chain 2, skeletal muscle isoform [Larimichthys crocea]|uniref:Uncharacterized protein n=1 Tax=Larimichthys crocea TaxID=215358 RepID=A0ACD3R5Y9_LARCR|nr:Myosin regulatory light chain 2, skeletal muscle isoform [Larimichthys crocea]
MVSTRVPTSLHSTGGSADPEDVILSAFKVLDPEGTGTIKKEFLEELLTTQCDRFSKEECLFSWLCGTGFKGGNKSGETVRKIPHEYIASDI